MIQLKQTPYQGWYCLPNTNFLGTTNPLFTSLTLYSAALFSKSFMFIANVQNRRVSNINLEMDLLFQANPNYIFNVNITTYSLIIILFL